LSIINILLFNFCLPFIFHHIALIIKIAKNEQINPVNLKDKNPLDIAIKEKRNFNNNDLKYVIKSTEEDVTKNISS
tara:strand:- start:224 stop:451 length:228 start_codon:yes stop_codon:yes gene_type:complete